MKEVSIAERCKTTVRRDQKNKVHSGYFKMVGWNEERFIFMQALLQ
jgi:hypothetical protein